MKVASTFDANTNRPDVRIDGVSLPWYVAEDGIEIEPGGREAFTVVRVAFFVDGIVIYDDGRRRQVVDPEWGDVGEFARRLVRDGLIEALPWVEGVA